MMRYDYYVTQVTPTGPCSSSWQDLINGAQDQILLDNPKQFQMNPCGQGPYMYSMQVVAAICWKIINLNPNPTETPMEVAVECSESAYCKSVAMTCKDPSTGEIIIITKSKHITQTPNCEEIDPVFPYGEGYEYGECFFFNQCE